MPPAPKEIGLFDGLPPFCSCLPSSECEGPEDHKADCDLLRAIDELYPQVLAASEPNNQSEDSEAGERPPDNLGADTRRRRNREMMARLRNKLRSSIGSLRVHERQLTQSLDSAIANFNRQSKTEQQRRYFELVKEQLALEDERKRLDAAFAVHDKYALLVQRGRDRIRRDRVETENECKPE